MEAYRVVTLNAPPALYLQEDPWFSFLLRLRRHHGHSAAGRISSIEKFHVIRNIPATFRLVA
jgi:hypothetical protein